RALGASRTVVPPMAVGAIPPPQTAAVVCYLAHRAVLPDCALVIPHAGLATVMAALAHGVPLLCLPMGREQHDNAARVAACGAGCVLPAEAEVGAIAHAIRTMLATPAYQTAARHMATTIARGDGREVAVDTLEHLLHT